MIESIVIDRVVVPAQALSMTAVRAGGPGGQNVNKVASKVELRVDLSLIEGLDEASLTRLHILVRNRLDAAGRLLVTSQKTRDQAKNLSDAMEKVRELVATAMVAPKPRKKTRPSRGAVRRRIEDKRKNSDRKRARTQRDD